MYIRGFIQSIAMLYPWSKSYFLLWNHIQKENSGGNNCIVLLILSMSYLMCRCYKHNTISYFTIIIIVIFNPPYKDLIVKISIQVKLKYRNNYCTKFTVSSKKLIQLHMYLIFYGLLNFFKAKTSLSCCCNL